MGDPLLLFQAHFLWPGFGSLITKDGACLQYMLRSLRAILASALLSLGSFQFIEAYP